MRTGFYHIFGFTGKMCWKKVYSFSKDCESNFTGLSDEGVSCTAHSVNLRY